MSKNLTRKGLALGALVALGSSVIAGAPAHAAATVSIDVAAGTGNTTILGESFSVRATLDSLAPATANQQLKFAVTNSSAATLAYTVGTAGDTFQAGSANTASSGTSDVVYDNTRSASALETSTLEISTTASAATSVSVVAFLDADGGNDLDSGEYQTAAYEVKFVKAADAGIVAAWGAAPQVGDTTAKVKLTSTVINVAQVNAAHFGVKIGNYVSGTKTSVISTGTTTYGTYTSSADAAAVTLNADTKASLDAKQTVSAVAAGTYVAQAVYSPTGTASGSEPTNLTDAGATDFVKVGSEITAGVAAATASAANSSSKIIAGANVTLAGAVRKGFTGDVTYEVTVKDADKALLAGKTVRLTTGTLTGTFKVNGVTAASSTAYEAATNASGVATFAVSSSTAATTDAFDVASITSEGVTVGTATDLSFAAVSYTLVEKGVYASADLDRGVDNATSASVEIVAVDQWKQALVSSSYRIKATQSSRTVAVLTDDFADGSAKFTITDGALNADQTTVAYAFEELTGTTWAAATTYTPTPLTNRIYYWYAQTDKVAITYDSATAAISGEALVAVDTRLSNTATAGSMNAAVISGTVRHATTEAAKTGALITISGPADVLFNVGDAYAFGSLTFYDANGTFSVNAYSTTVQADTVITVKSQAATDTVKVSFTAPTAASVVKSVKVSGPATLVPGRTATITVKALDEFGNAVNLGSTDDDLTVTLAGPGYLSTYPVTLSEGSATFTLIVGSSEAGTSVITAKADLGASDAISGTLSVVVAAATAVVVEPTSKIGTANSRVYVNVKDGKGSVVSVKIGAKWYTKSALNNDYTFSFKAKAKSKVSVKVYVDGDLSSSKTIVVKK